MSAEMNKCRLKSSRGNARSVLPYLAKGESVHNVLKSMLEGRCLWTSMFAGLVVVGSISAYSENHIVMALYYLYMEDIFLSHSARRDISGHCC